MLSYSPVPRATTASAEAVSAATATRNQPKTRPRVHGKPQNFPESCGLYLLVDGKFAANRARIQHFFNNP
jgi:hypothetical protein